ncbi:MAG TPA: hypothetical protein VEU96_04435 [Bryobacteraceae bacterium]|nr:hypothetical protein [Bryobacteraceae bacterium]
MIALLLIDSSDIGLFIFAGVVALATVVFCVRYLRAYYRAAAERWKPLAPMVNGQAKGAMLKGTLDELPLAAQIWSQSDESSRSCFWRIELIGKPLGQDWEIRRDEECWRVQTNDAALRFRLEAELPAMTAMLVLYRGNFGRLLYTAKRGSLSYDVGVTGDIAIPTPEEFGAQLRMMSALNQINQRALTQAPN